MATKGKTTVKFNKILQENNYLLSGEKKNKQKNLKRHNSKAVMTVQICDSRKKSYEATEN